MRTGTITENAVWKRINDTAELTYGTGNPIWL
jgi:hypothetical protein